MTEALPPLTACSMPTIWANEIHAVGGVDGNRNSLFVTIPAKHASITGENETSVFRKFDFSSQQFSLKKFLFFPFLIFSFSILSASSICGQEVEKRFAENLSGSKATSNSEQGCRSCFLIKQKIDQGNKSVHDISNAEFLKAIEKMNKKLSNDLFMYCCTLVAMNLALIFKSK